MSKPFDSLLIAEGRYEDQSVSFLGASKQGNSHTELETLLLDFMRVFYAWGLNSSAECCLDAFRDLKAQTIDSHSGELRCVPYRLFPRVWDDVTFNYERVQKDLQRMQIPREQWPAMFDPEHHLWIHGHEYWYEWHEWNLGGVGKNPLVVTGFPSIMERYNPDFHTIENLRNPKHTEIIRTFLNPLLY